MALQSSGTISMDDIRDEMGETGEVNLRDLASAAGFSTPDLMSDFYGYEHTSLTELDLDFNVSSSFGACNFGSATTVYTDGTNTPQVNDTFYSDAAGTTVAPRGYYSNTVQSYRILSSTTGKIISVSNC